MLVGIVMLVIVSIFIFALNNNNQKFRKRWGKDQYRIGVREYFTDGIKKSEIYYIEQKCKHFLFGEMWVSVKTYSCGYGDCYWEESQFGTMADAQLAVRKLRAGDKWYGHKETIVKNIP